MSDEFKVIEGIDKQTVAPATQKHYKRSEATAIQLKNGNIFLLWSDYVDVGLMPEEERPQRDKLHWGPVGDDGYARVSGMISKDGGYTWTDRRVYADDEDTKINCILPCLTRMPDDRLLMAYAWRSGGNPGAPGREGIYSGACEKRVRYSSDEGKTWCEPVAVTPRDGLYHTGAHDRAYTLPSGRVLVQCHSRFKQEGDQKMWRRMWTWTAYSDDNGATWQMSNPIGHPHPPGITLSEGSIAQRGDGSLLKAIRSRYGQLFYAESTDEGATWGNAYPSSIISSGAPAYITRMPDSEDLLIIWNSGYNPDVGMGSWVGHRNPLLCAISKDGGKSWGLPKALETDASRGEDSWAYPGVLFLEDKALVYYHHGRPDVNQWSRELILADVPIDWFYDREF